MEKEVIPLRQRIFLIAFTLIGLSILVHTIAAYAAKLEKPIFLDHVIHFDTEHANSLELYYITNKFDKSFIQQINLRTDSDNWFSRYSPDLYVDQNLQPNNLRTFGPYVVRQESFSISELEMSDQPITITSIDVYFSNGQYVQASIGEIQLFEQLEQPDVLQWLSSSGINHESTTRFKVKEALTIEHVILPEHVFFSITLNSKQTDQALPLHLKKDDIVVVQVSPESSSRSLHVVWSLAGTTDKGEPFQNSNSHIEYPVLTKDDVLQLIKEKGKTYE